MSVSESADIPVCSSLGMVGGAEELIDRADKSRPEGTAGAAGGGVTAESCTCRR